MWAAQHCSRLFLSTLNRLCVFTRVHKVRVRGERPPKNNKALLRDVSDRIAMSSHLSYHIPAQVFCIKLPQIYNLRDTVSYFCLSIEIKIVLLISNG